MIPGLLLPAGLAALAALLIPLVIHIARRTEQRTILFAALRWLEARPRPRAQRRLDELALLAARLALLALLALYLAQPVIWNVQDRRPVIAVMPVLGRAAVPAPQIEGRRAVWLAPGFPPFSAPLPTQSAKPAKISSLLRQLDAELPAGAALDVFVPATLDDADGERPRLSRAVRWRVLSDPGPAASKQSLPPPPLVVRYAPDGAARARWFRAAAQAWVEPGVAPAFEADTIARPIAQGAHNVIWLAPGPAPEALIEWVRRGGVALLAHDAKLPAQGEAVTLWQDAEGAPLITSEALGAGRVLRLQRPLVPAAMPALLEPDFPRVLARLLQPTPPPTRVRAFDYAPLLVKAARPDRAYFPLQAWFALAAALMFILERWLATRARPAAPP